MYTFTLDTNCIFALEESQRIDRLPVLQIVEAHLQKRASVGLVAISASERQRGGKPLENFRQFKDRIAELGLGSLEILIPMMYWDVTFWDFSVWADETMEDLERQIHEVLFPAVGFTWAEHCEQTGIRTREISISSKRLNAKCDVQVFWSHVFHKRDVFVTSDLNFHAVTKKERLESLGNCRIEMPSVAATLC